MSARSFLRSAFIGPAAIFAVLAISSGVVLAAPGFSGVAAGDMTKTDAILWTRTFDPATGEPVAAALTAQLAAEPEFRDILFTYKGTTDPARAGTTKSE